MKAQYQKYSVWSAYIVSLYFLVFSTSVIIKNQNNFENLVDSYSDLAAIYEDHLDLGLLDSDKRKVVEKTKKDILWNLDGNNHSGVKFDLSLYYWLFVLGVSGIALPNIIKQTDKLGKSNQD